MGANPTACICVIEAANKLVKNTANKLVKNTAFPFFIHANGKGIEKNE